MPRPLRWLFALVAAAMVVWFGALCVHWGTSWFLDPFYDAPVEDDPRLP